MSPWRELLRDFDQDEVQAAEVGGICYGDRNATQDKRRYDDEESNKEIGYHELSSIVYKGRSQWQDAT
jgi:hypothetical protein